MYSRSKKHGKSWRLARVAVSVRRQTCEYRHHLMGRAFASWMISHRSIYVLFISAADMLWWEKLVQFFPPPFVNPSISFFQVCPFFSLILHLPCRTSHHIPSPVCPLPWQLAKEYDLGMGDVILKQGGFSQEEVTEFATNILPDDDDSAGDMDLDLDLNDPAVRDAFGLD